VTAAPSKRGIIRLLDRINDAAYAALAARYTAAGYFPDTPSAMRFIDAVDPRGGARQWRALWRMLRLKSPVER
jgi:hypothetical protein